MMNDKFFGKLVYDGGWTKKEAINFWGKDSDVKIIVSAYENEKPNAAQQNAYERFKNDLNIISEMTLKKLKTYIKTIEDDVIAYTGVSAIPEEIFELVIISEILFMESGSFAIMCKAKWDSHGVAILCKESEIEVGPQDIVWFEE